MSKNPNKDKSKVNSITWQRVVGWIVVGIGVVLFVVGAYFLVPSFRFESGDIKTAFEFLGGGVLIANIGLFVIYLDKINKQLEEQQQGHYLQMRQHGIDMLYGNEKQAFAGVSQLHGLAEKHGSDERKDILDTFCLFIRVTSEIDKKEQASKGEDKVKVNDVAQEILRKICYKGGIYSSKKINLAKANLREAELRSAELQKAELEGAELQKADLGSANLKGANLKTAKLQKAHLCDADLGGADLWGTDLKGANLCDADLCDADLGRADLTGANLKGADLQGARLAFTNLKGADLRWAKLRGADLSDNIKLSCAIVCSSSEDCIPSTVKEGRDLIIWYDDTKSKPFTLQKEEYSPKELVEELGKIPSDSSHYYIIKAVIDHILELIDDVA